MWSSLDEILNEAITSKTVPGLGLCVRIGDQNVYHRLLGQAQLTPHSRPVEEDTLWDLASLTKVLCTAPLMLSLYDHEKIDLFKAPSGFPEAISPASLLSHSSGLPAWKAFYVPYLLRQQRWAQGTYQMAIVNRVKQYLSKASRKAGYAYSDLGYILLGQIISEKTGLRLDEAWHSLLPNAATEGLMWGPSPSQRTAATEHCPLRRRVICGDVHDLNAAAMGGVAGHAGLFGSLSATARAAHWPLDVWHGRCQHVRASSLRTFWSTTGLGSHVLGWDRPSGPNSSASELWPKDGVGHLAFTGCSIWLAPKLDLSVTFVSNRLHPVAYGGVLGGFNAPKYIAFRKLRQDIHREIMKICASAL